MQKEISSKFAGTINKTHGEKGTRLYTIWANMKQRCNLKTSKDYRKYGGRGIKVCSEWAQSFEAFRDWAISNGYRDNLTIDRINNDGDYCPENCRWTTVKAQANNRRSNRLLTYKGETKTMQQWCDIFGITKECVSYRLKKGWPIERALTETTGGGEHD